MMRGKPCMRLPETGAGQGAEAGRTGAMLRAVALLAGLLAAGGMAQAQARDDGEPVLEGSPAVKDFIEYAYNQNPRIKAAREAWRGVVEKYRLQTAYPDPSLSVTYFPDPIETRLGPQDWNANLSLKVPFPGKLSKEGEVVEIEAGIARLNLDRAVRDVATSIRESLHELAYIEAAKTVAAENSRLLAHFRKVTESAYAEDRATLTDMVKAQSQTGQLQYDQLLLEDLETTEKTRLNALLSRPPDAPIGRVRLPEPLPLAYSLEEIYAAAEAGQEEIKILAMGIAKADTQIELANYQNLPDFSLGLFYAGIGHPDTAVQPADAGDDALGVQFGVTIPLWFGKNRGRVEQARAEKRQAEALKAARIDDSRAEIRSLYFHLQNSTRIMTLYREQLLPEAARAMTLAESQVREGDTSYSDFLEAQSVWYNFQLAEARAPTTENIWRAWKDSRAAL
jgi:cobalt-zinc-cadmium efflux system outer membrane protein